MTTTSTAHKTTWVVVTLSATLLMLSAYGGELDPRQWGYVPGVLVIVFPLIALVVLTTGIVMAAMRRWWQCAVVAVALLAALPMVSVIIPTGTAHESEGQSFTVMTYNVASFPRVHPGDTSDVMRTILDINADIVLMQEMMLAPRPFHYDEVPAIKCYLDELNEKYPYRSYPHSDDVAILSKYPFITDTIVAPQRGYDALSDYNNHLHYATLAYDIKINVKKLRLISTHLRSYGLSNADKRLVGADTSDTHDVSQGSVVHDMTLSEKLSRAFALRAQEATQLRQAIDAGPATVIVCGDFNDVARSYAYNTVKGRDMRDAWVEAGRGYAYTYSKRPMLFKIDHILYRGPLKALDSHVYNDVRTSHTASDHYPQVAKFAFN